jgi:UDP-N-acetylglucosamine 2-epimerase (non-hydrolysing)/GDP/UDP-N,N'-diacetylbacillosamine 2-epimerase (hydrolysing)
MVEICVVTSTRADYGLLYPVLRALVQHNRYRLQLVVTGTHLSEQFGHTVDEIKADGFEITEQIEILEPGDTPAAISATIGRAAGQFGSLFERMRPDLVLVLGDRYEMLPVALTAHIARIPVAHLCGGDVTKGAIDDAIRHSISKLSQLHFVTNEESGRRVRQLGEDPDHIYVVGETGIDNIRLMKFLSREQLGSELGYEWRKHNLLVTFHPVTLGDTPSIEQLEHLLLALDELGSDYGIILTFPNADPEGRAMLERLHKFAADRDNVHAYASLGRKRYLSAMHHVDAVVGNSSSGLIEGPAMPTATVNIGNRQEGRPLADSVVQCDVDRGEIVKAVKRAVAMDCSRTMNPYGDGHATEKIIAVLDGIEDFSALTTKRFIDL